MSGANAGAAGFEPVPEHDGEPIRGLPGALPPGERILWSGAPEWLGLARRVFFLRAAAIWFAAIMILRGLAVSDQGTAAALSSATALLPIAIAGLGLIALLAWITARTTVYTITNRRVVLRIGVALQLCVNVPFTKVGSAALRLTSRGRGDIPLRLVGDDRFSYVMLWPHARPWRFARPEPMLRAVADAERVAGILAEALRNAQTETDAAEADAAELKSASVAARRGRREDEGAAGPSADARGARGGETGVATAKPTPGDIDREVDAAA